MTREKEDRVSRTETESTKSFLRDTMNPTVRESRKIV